MSSSHCVCGSSLRTPLSKCLRCNRPSTQNAADRTRDLGLKRKQRGFDSDYFSAGNLSNGCAGSSVKRVRRTSLKSDSERMYSDESAVIGVASSKLQQEEFVTFSGRFQEPASDVALCERVQLFAQRLSDAAGYSFRAKPSDEGGKATFLCSQSTSCPSSSGPVKKYPCEGLLSVSCDRNTSDNMNTFSVNLFHAFKHPTPQRGDQMRIDGVSDTSTPNVYGGSPLAVINDVFHTTRGASRPFRLRRYTPYSTSSDEETDKSAKERGFRSESKRLYRGPEDDSFVEALIRNSPSPKRMTHALPDEQEEDVEMPPSSVPTHTDQAHLFDDLTQRMKSTEHHPIRFLGSFIAPMPTQVGNDADPLEHYARTVGKTFHQHSGYKFFLHQSRTLSSGGNSTRYRCSQNEWKPKLSGRHSAIDKFGCKGRMTVTCVKAAEDNKMLVTVRMGHVNAHPPRTDRAAISAAARGSPSRLASDSDKESVEVIMPSETKKLTPRAVGTLLRRFADFIEHSAGDQNLMDQVQTNGAPFFHFLETKCNLSL